jgi:glycine oxidase
VGSPDYVIAGAGIIGLSLALELNRRGASVTVLDAGSALQQTSSAAAGMLAIDDPLNPSALRPLAALSASLYPAFLDRIAELSGTRVPFQTSTTLEAGDAANALPDPRALVPQLDPGNHRFHLLKENSVDPRQLASALLAAVRATSIDLREHTSLQRIATTPTSVRIHTSAAELEASALIDCMGTWSPAPVSPRKGQMLSVAIPPELDLACVLRTPDIYIVPRTEGPNAGRAIIGATLEDAGFDLTVHSLDILTLNARAVKLLPILANADFLESWSGLRPSTADALPILGAAPRQPRYLLATGHFRNGILLAPATALVIAQLLSNETPSIDLTPFTPTRF